MFLIYILLTYEDQMNKYYHKTAVLMNESSIKNNNHIYFTVGLLHSTCFA